MGKSRSSNLEGLPFFSRMIKKFLTPERLCLIAIILVGAFFRLWQIESGQYFTYDQARDYLIIKKMVVDGKLTLVGPTVSIAPGFFLPPFYYYSLIPFLWLFKFHLFGPDFYTALLGIASIYLFYLLAKDFFGQIPTLVSSFAFALNPYLIQTNRHAWNPNTLVFFILFFALAGERYLFSRKKTYLFWAIFSLSWAIGLHLTAIAFVPLAVYLLYHEIKVFGLNKRVLLSFLAPLLIVFPLVAFDFRHRFPISKAALSYLTSQKQGPFFSSLLIRLTHLFFDLVKVPVTLFSGLFQVQNLTIRPSNITAFSRVSFGLTATSFDKLKLFFTILIIAFSVFAFSNYFKRFPLKAKYIAALWLMGFLVRLFFPVSSFYFYYYLILFPFLFLLFTFFIFNFYKARNSGKGKIFSISAVMIISVFSLLPGGIKSETRPESYFLPACKIIADDYLEGKEIAIVSNPADSSRWEKNGLEYRYFLETKFNLPLKDWEIKDYQRASILYLVDEGRLKDPLSLRGMEMESFEPKRVEKVWQAETGQKIYKLLK